jgi:hypothetical protein
MRRALQPRPSTLPVSAPTSLPAPVGGWNARDGLANMEITDAISMDNWYPEATDVRPRPGSDTYASGLPGQVETIFSYSNGSNLKLFVAAEGIITNISTVQASGTVIASATVASGFTEDQWQYRNFGTPGGQFLVAVNGTDARQIYNGTTWFAGSVYATTTIDTFSNIEVFQRRIIYAEKGTLRFIYHVQPDAIGGTVSAFNLASLMDMGGYIAAIGTWTRDGGSGMDDLIAFISNLGQVAIYQGTDPSSATTWSLLGIFKISAPMGARSVQKYGGELLILTDSGVLPLSSIISGLVQQPPYTDKIRTAINEAVRLYGDHSGWQLKYVPSLNWLMLNVPVSTGAFQQQFVMNTQTMAWCRFRDLQANVWEVHNGELYFGTSGSVIKAGTSSDADDGDNINVDVRQAASAFGLPGRLKHFKAFRPLINSDGDLPLATDINVDFSDAIPTNIPTTTPVTTAVWDVATWDDYYWADGAVPVLFWQSTGGLGTYGSVRIKGQINTISVRWYGTDVVFEPGGML